MIGQQLSRIFTWTMLYLYLPFSLYFHYIQHRILFMHIASILCEGNDHQEIIYLLINAVLSYWHLEFHPNPLYIDWFHIPFFWNASLPKREFSYYIVVVAFICIYIYLFFTGISEVSGFSQFLLITLNYVLSFTT